MRKLRGKHKSVGSVPLFGNRSLRSVEALEKRVMLAADFEVVNSGNDFWIEANGTNLTINEADAPVGDTFTLRHISQNEVHVRIDFPVDLDGNGKADSNDFIVGVFDLDFYEFQAALAGKNFLGIKVNALAGNDTIDAMRMRHHDDGQLELNGGDGNDLIIGGRRGDKINGGEGDDAIERADNVDVISGGGNAVGSNNPLGLGNDDSVRYGNHSGPAQDNDIPLDDVEYVDGTGFNDVIDLSGNTVPVIIIGGAGNDTLTGGSANDNIDGGAGDDTINGNGGDDTLNGGAGDDTINGGTGNDNISGGVGNDKLYGDEGNDTISGDAGDDELFGGTGNDTLNGGIGEDKLYGESGNDTLNGGDGNDYLNGGADGDVISGGAGNDTSDYDDDGDGVAGVTVDLQLGLGDGGHATGDTYPVFEAGTRAQADGNNDVENIDGTNFADTLRGDVDANRLVGKGGDDIIIGRDGNDYLDGGAGNDKIGNDYRPGAATAENREQFIAGSVGVLNLLNGLRGTLENGNDEIHGGDGDDELRGGADNDTVYGGAGDDIIEGDAWYDTTTPAVSPVTHIASGNDSIYGGTGNDTLYATDSRDWLAITGADPLSVPAAAAVGSDFIDGEAGDDTIRGHIGVDMLFGDMDIVNGGNDSIWGYDGNDQLNGGNGDDYLNGGLGIDLLRGGDTGFDTLEIEATGSGFGAGLVDFIANAGAGPDRFIVTGISSADTIGQLVVESELDNDQWFLGDIFSDFDSGIDILDFV